jgi:hypothetical protein
MLLFIIFLICVYYEDVRGVSDFIKFGPDKREDFLEIGGDGMDFIFKFHGRITEFVYLCGLVYGMVRGPYSWVFAIVLFLAQIPKDRLGWTIIDSLFSILTLTMVFLLVFQDQIFEILTLIIS